MHELARTRIYDLLRSGPARTGKELEELTGASRVTTTQRLTALVEAGLVLDSGRAVSSGGRPARSYTLNPGFRNLIGADIGETMGRICLFDLGLRFLDERLFRLDLRADPHETLDRLVAETRLLAASPRATAPVAGFGISLPAPVYQNAGKVAEPSVMYGWERIALRDLLRGQLEMPVGIDNDVNLMCLAEHRQRWPHLGTLLFIKAGTGIGCGIINEGRLLRGAFGASGDIGHIQHTDAPHKLCRCGKEGCIEAHAGGWALARDLRELGLETFDARDVMACYFRGDPECRKAVHQASRTIGTVAADLVSILNPEALVIGGRLATAGEAMLSGIRERVYQRCLPLATRQLQIAAASSDDRLGATGAAMLAMECALVEPGG